MFKKLAISVKLLHVDTASENSESLLTGVIFVETQVWSFPCFALSSTIHPLSGFRKQIYGTLSLFFLLCLRHVIYPSEYDFVNV